LKAANAIKEADALLFTSGAGMSVGKSHQIFTIFWTDKVNLHSHLIFVNWRNLDSGLPDLRGPQGFWRVNPPMAKLGLKFENVLTPKWFTEDPDFAWGFWAHRISL
jgi:NAD-dependent SIR2 family protein deacetylase